jgi:hypothetical protein
MERERDKPGAILMQLIRITIPHNPSDPADDLRRAAQIRRDLWAHSPVEIDPNSEAHGTHRDQKSKDAYFEFATDLLPEVRRVLREFGHNKYARVKVVADGNWAECLNCGKILLEPVAVCPNCEFRDIEPCPYCDESIPRLEYLSIKGDVFKCPNCHHRVRFRFNDPLFDVGGHVNEPVVLVSRAEAPVHGL